MNIKSENKKQNSSVKKVFNVIGNIIITLYVVLVIFFSVSVFTSMATGYPSVLGYSLLFVETDSMESDAKDAIFVNDLVLCRELDSYYGLEVGQIIAYKVDITKTQADGDRVSEQIVRIHRIVETYDGHYITAGDKDKDENGMPLKDIDPVYFSEILGVYEGKRLPMVGKFFDFIQSQNGILFCLVIPMAAFFIYALFKFVKAMIEYKLEKATSGAPADGELTEEQKQAAIAEYLAKQASEANKEENNTDQNSEE